MEPILVDRKCAAKLLGISLRKLDYLVAEGALRSGKVGRRVVLNYRSLIQFAERNTRPKKQMTQASETV
jgi:excisionase family DNA binding protein